MAKIESISIRPADNGGFVANVESQGKKNKNGYRETKYETLAFASATALTLFVEEALG